MALALAVHIGLLLARVLKVVRDQPANVRRPLVRPAVGLAALLLRSVGLGLGTWIAKYGWPAWLGPAWFGLGERDFVVVAEGALQAHSPRPTWPWAR